MRMLAERIDDRAIPRLIKKWLRAGVLDTDGDGAVTDEKVDALDCHGARRICRPAFLRSKVSSSCLDELPWCRSSKKVHRQNTRGTATKEEAKKVEEKNTPYACGTCMEGTLNTIRWKEIERTAWKLQDYMYQASSRDDGRRRLVNGIGFLILNPSINVLFENI